MRSVAQDRDAVRECTHLFEAMRPTSANGDATRLPELSLEAAEREQILRALRTIPNLSLYTSHFLASKVWMKRADGGGYVRVLKSEERL